MKIASTNYALCMAQSPAQKKKAVQTKSSLERYSSSCFLQLLDDKPAPVDSHLDEIKKERLAQAAKQKQRLSKELAAKLDHVNHDHTYAVFSGEVEYSSFPSNDSPTHESHGMQLYNSEVVIDVKLAKELEGSNQIQIYGTTKES